MMTCCPSLLSRCSIKSNASNRVGVILSSGPWRNRDRRGAGEGLGEGKGNEEVLIRIFVTIVEEMVLYV